MSSPRHSRTRAFTLIELLVVIAIILILMGLAVPAFRASIAQQAPHSDADRLLSMLRSARQHAIVNNTRTRVVFATEELEQLSRDLGENPPLEAGRAFTSFVFDQPNLPNTGTRQDSVAGGGGAFVPKNLESVPAAFVGQWRPLRPRGGWHRLTSNTMSLNSEEFADTDLFPDRPLRNDQAALNDLRFDANFLHIFENLPEAEAADFLRSELVYSPTLNWAWTDVRFTDGEGFAFSGSSQFPQNYFQTPYPRVFPVILNTTLPPEDVPNPFIEGSYDEIWAFGSNSPTSGTTNILWRFFSIPAGMEFDVGNLFANEDFAEEGIHFLNLPAVEYDNRGIPQFSTNRLVFRFAQVGNPDNYVDIVVNRTDGIPRRIQP
ncbi:MAG: prepilin-type N-terminal cleavage/methylation domain-containing protein [Opitutales bacterium]|nr:prepilin-type N-terminal cleavage/methylation domain-containing protein [Opitutales bacterium]MCH8541402.1 prepilin-type N-terminal cleavage/methylation domain-containing protein [Opitutales bacterium]